MSETNNDNLNPEAQNQGNAQDSKLVQSQLASLTATGAATVVSEELITLAATQGMAALSDNEREMIELAMINEPGLAAMMLELKTVFAEEAAIDTEVTRQLSHLTVDETESAKVDDELIAKAATDGMDALTSRERDALQVALINEPGLASMLMELRSVLKAEKAEAGSTDETGKQPALKLVTNQSDAPIQKTSKTYLWMTRLTSVGLVAAASLSLVLYNMEDVDSMSAMNLTRDQINQANPQQTVTGAPSGSVGQPGGIQAFDANKNNPLNTQLQPQGSGKVKPFHNQNTQNYFDQIPRTGQPAQPVQTPQQQTAQPVQPVQPAPSGSNTVAPATAPTTSQENLIPIEKLSRSDKDLLLIITTTTSVVLAVILLLLLIGGAGRRA